MEFHTQKQPLLEQFLQVRVELQALSDETIVGVWQVSVALLPHCVDCWRSAESATRFIVFLAAQDGTHTAVQ